jgi:hypothetical protein
MRLRMLCGHTIDVDVDKVPSPTCHCGERQVVRALNPGHPRIVGHARGPLVEGRYLGPTAVDLTQRVVAADGTTQAAGPLTLKPDTQRSSHATPDR